MCEIHSLQNNTAQTYRVPHTKQCKCIKNKRKQIETNKLKSLLQPRFHHHTPSVLPFDIAEPHYIPSAASCEEQSTINLSACSYSQILERNAFCMWVQYIVRHTQLHFASRQIGLRTQLQQKSEPTSQRGRSTRQLRGTHHCFLEPCNQIGPRHYFWTRQLHRLSRKGVRIHAVLANRSGHIAHPHRLLKSTAAIDIDQPRIDVQLTANPANESVSAGLPGQ